MPTVTTINGEVDSAELGLTLMHEHLMINQMREQRRIGLVHDRDALLAELDGYRNLGGRTIVELTSGELAHGAATDPAHIYRSEPRSDDGAHTRGIAHVVELQSLSRDSGVHVVAGTGHYRDPYLDKRWFDEHSVDEIASLLVRDLEDGFPGTSARAGIIGEIGSDKWFISAAEERSFRAAARAGVRTGTTITTHAARWPVGMEQLKILTSEGVDPARVIIGHCDSVPIPEYHADIAKSGAWVQFDGIRSTIGDQLRRRVGWVVDLCRAGYLSRILLSHDVCTLDDLSTYGGCGFTFVSTVFRDALIQAGLNDSEVEQMLVHNPARALCG
jgi:predicted metal-dependent phosphotriesterase family hydrolase